MAYRITRFDEDDAFAWRKVVSTFAGDDVLQSMKYHYDDGTATAYHYKDGVLEKKVSTDGKNDNFHFVSKTEYFDADGKLTETHIEYDGGRSQITRVDPQGFITSSTIDDGDGVIRDETYEMGILVQRVDVNLRVGAADSSADWSLQTTTFDDYSGIIESVVTHFPDGRETTDAYKAGRLITHHDSRVEGLTQTTRFDADGRETSVLHYDGSEDGALKQWESRETSFDAAGDVESKTVMRDNGVETVAHFSNGQITSKTVTDTEDVMGFETRMDIFNAGGLLASRSTLRDDGTSRTDKFQDEMLASRTRVDGEGEASQHAWESVTATYDANGQITRKDFTMDDGGSRVDRFDEAGARVSSTQTDGGKGEGHSFRPWDVLTRFFNPETGARTKAVAREDDGDTIVFTYAADESPALRIETDNDGSDPWKVQVRDFTGPKQVTTEYAAAEDVPAHYAAYIDEIG